MENCLWGSPRIHGELLKLGIVVSERTVLRYLPDRRTVPSQTWRTFLANDLAWTSPGRRRMRRPMTTSSTRVVYRSVPLRRSVTGDAPSLSGQLSIGRCHQRTSLGWPDAQDPLHQRTQTPSGRDPPADVSRRSASRRKGRLPAFRDAIWPPMPMNSLTSLPRPAAGSPIGPSESCLFRSLASSEGRNVVALAAAHPFCVRFFRRRGYWRNTDLKSFLAPCLRAR